MKTATIRPISSSEWNNILEMNYESQIDMSSEFSLNATTLQIREQSHGWSCICWCSHRRAFHRNFPVATSRKTYESAIPEIFSRLASQILIAAK